MAVSYNPNMDWATALKEEKQKPYFKAVLDFIKQEKQAGKQIFPPSKHIFRALAEVPLDRVRVVIIGQDPYHQPGQAHGLSFSVADGVQIPPSLRNIYQEIKEDLGVEPPESGDLLRWAQEGVLLLNSVLTVEANQAGSHAGRGWEEFTDAVIRVVNEHTEHTVFLLWGAYAKRKGEAVDESRHLVLSAPHPSPLSAHRGFFGCRHFSKANQYLEQNGLKPVRW